MKTKRFMKAFAALGAFIISLAYTETYSIYAHEEQNIPGNGGGYIHNPYETYNQQDSENALYGPVVKAENLPSAYDLRDEGCVTSVKNQGAEGMCHAFAAVGACESNLLKQGLETDAETLDLSEGQLGYFLYTLQGDPLDPLYGDYLSTPGKGSGGGNGLLAAAGLAEGFGLEQEKYCEYKDFSGGYSEYSRYAGQYRLRTCENISRAQDTASKNTVKKWLMESGAVAVAFCSQHSLYYDNGTTYSYYAENKSFYEDANHAALIVGWDDDYSKENFSPKGRPSNNGAWLVKNSYGADLFDDGYFWISYEDPSMGSFCRYIVEKVSSYDDVYEYDSAGYITAYSFDAAANVFTAESDCILTDVSFYMPAGNPLGTKYDVKVYRLRENTSDPTDGEIIGNAQGIISASGYLTVPLNEQAELKKGEQFSLVLRMSHSNRNYVIYLPVEERTAIGTSFSVECDADYGESYVLSDGVWEDTSVNEGERGSFGNIPLKAFAVRTEEYTPFMLNAAIDAAEQSGINDELLESAVIQGKEIIADGAGAASCRRAAGTILSILENYGAVAYPEHIYDDYSVNSGDVNDDWEVGLTDATEVLEIYAMRSAGYIRRLSRRTEIAMNTVSDRMIDLSDASWILQKYAESAAGIE